MRTHDDNFGSEPYLEERFAGKLEEERVYKFLSVSSEVLLVPCERRVATAGTRSKEPVAQIATKT